MTLQEIIEQLHAILSEKDNETRGKLVTKFDDLIFMSDDLEVSEEVEDVLLDLAHDLEYYEADPEERDESSYGEERLGQEINEALQKIEDLRNQK